MAEDSSGNKSVIYTRVVTVSDNEGQTITLKGNMEETIEGNTVYTDPGYTASDNYDPTVTVTVAGTYPAAFAPTYKATTLGDYTFTYSATDAAGNKTVVTRTIHVVDDIAPLIDLKGPSAAVICRWQTYVDSGYTVSDNFSPNSDITVTMSNTISTSLDGLYAFRYMAKDKVGNTAYSPYRYVLVKSTGECASGIADKGTENNSVNVYPNPNAGIFTVKVNTTKIQNAKISVTDMMGKEISVINNGLLTSDIYTVNLTAQAAGIYFVNVVTDKGTIVNKVNIVH